MTRGRWAMPVLWAGLWVGCTSVSSPPSDSGAAKDQPRPGPAEPGAPLRLAAGIRDYLRSRTWTAMEEPPILTRGILEASLEAGRRFLLRHQKPEGNFDYQYDFVAQQVVPGDMPVRQVGALWGLVLLHGYAPGEDTRRAIDRGLKFFFERSAAAPDGSLFLRYPGAAGSPTGAVALLVLCLVDYLRTEPELAPDYRARLLQRLDGYLRFLGLQEMPGGGFRETYWDRTGRLAPRSNPYYDGEALLALCRAARHLNLPGLRPIIDRQVPAMADYYTITAWKRRPDPEPTKAFFHWGIMAFWEYSQARWPHRDLYDDTILALAWWMIHTHRVLERKRNTAYAYEGLVHAWLTAQARGHEEAASEIRHTIDRGLRQLVTWQVGGPLASENPFLAAHPTDDPRAVGGCMNGPDDPQLRIDVTQHQMHATILALRHLYGTADR